ncbi:MAG: hypothetical protein PWR32_103 [Candidatus Woesearchaeota archaeon]|nr:hypothetical protein [Candidatus Woesearchaeota archaeon]
MSFDGTSVFLSIGIIMILSSTLAYLFRKIKQPTLIAYLLSGIIFKLVISRYLNIESTFVESLSELGVAFLLFIVGLELNLNKVKSVKKVAIFGGLVSTTLSFLMGLILFLPFSKDWIKILYFAIIFCFSSTMVIVKQLFDRKEIDTIHARIMIGILLLQDILAIFALTVLENLKGLSISVFLIQFIKIFTLLAIIVLFSKKINKHIFHDAARNQELLFVMSLSYAFLFGILALKIGVIFDFFIKLFGLSLNETLSKVLLSGFSISIGSFLAGVSLANLPYNLEIASKIRPIRDFFSIIFFVSLGLQIESMSPTYFKIFLIAFLASVIGKPIINTLTTSFFGYKRRTSFLVGINMIPLSEFGLIIAYLGYAKGYLSSEFISMVIFLMISTVIVSSYLSKSGTKIFYKIKNKIKFLDWKNNSETQEEENVISALNQKDGFILLCGYNRTGYSLLKRIRELNKDVLVVDYNPDVIDRLKRMNVPCIYGDISEDEILDSIDFSKVSIVISTIQEVDDNLLLLSKIKSKNKKALIFMTANQIDDALILYENGADYIILPHFLGGEHASMLLERILNQPDIILTNKLQHIEELIRRKELGHDKN